MQMKRVWRCGGMTILIALILVGCGKSQPEAARGLVNVSVLTLQGAEVTLTDELPGRVTAVRTAEIRPQVGGIIQRRLFEQGTEIRAGQPLFQINPAAFRAEVDIVTATLQRAQVVWERERVQAARLEPLRKAGVVSPQVYDDAVSQRDQAAAEVAQARATLARRHLDLKFTTVDAPISGRIDQAQVTEGALVMPNDSNPMARIQQIDQIYVDVRQPASALESLRDALAVKMPEDSLGRGGLPVTILRSNGEPYPQTGRILFSGINVEAGTGDVLLRILVDNPQRVLLPGMFVRARVPRGTHADALLVPQQAVSHAGGETQIWTVDAQNRARVMTLQLGELVGHQYRIRSGLNPGQRVVIEGIERLADGMEVAPKTWQESATNALATAR